MKLPALAQWRQHPDLRAPLERVDLALAGHRRALAAANESLGHKPPGYGRYERVCLTLCTLGVLLGAAATLYVAFGH